MDLENLDRFMPKLVISLGVIDIGLVIIGVTYKKYYDVLILPITVLTIITLVCCFVGYLVNQKYLKSDD